VRFSQWCISVTAWSAPAQQLLQYIPTANSRNSTFTGSGIETVRDDKTSGRIDATARAGASFRHTSFL